MNIEQLKKEITDELAELTDNFLEDSFSIRTKTEKEKEIGVEILRDYYDIVEVSDGRRDLSDKLSWVITCKNPKPKVESLTEAADDDENEMPDDSVEEEPIDEPDDNIDLGEFDDLSDDMDLADEHLNTIDDVSEIDKANQLTLLKKRASAVGDKWREMFDEISLLARSLGLVATHDDKFNIELKKPTGERGEFEQDLKDIERKLFSDDIDDSFGPSEYDSRATELKDEPFPVQEESFSNLREATLTEAKYPWNKDNGTMNLNSNISFTSDPNEIPIREDQIDDDF